MTADALVIVLTGSCVGAACALVGTFLVLRRMALLGDAISHAVLPGIAVAFLLAGSRSPLPMLLGAGTLGVLTVFLVDLLNRTRRVQADAAIGVVFPGLFSIGVILASRYAARIDLDADCVLFGEIAYANLYRIHAAGVDLGPRALWVTGAILAIDLALVAVLFKELKIASFDPGLAASIGFSPVLLHYLLMAAVSVTVVGAFESVGAILVVAMLVAPPAAAYLLTDRLSFMLLLAVAFGIASSVLGYALAIAVDGSIAGAMAVAAGALFVIVLALAPRHGLLARLHAGKRIGRVFDRELVLLHLKNRLAPLGTGELAARFGWSSRRVSRAAALLESEGLVSPEHEGYRITARGVAALERVGAAPLAHPREGNGGRAPPA